MDGVSGATTTAIAIDKDNNNQYAVKWAIENVVNKMSCVALLHVLTLTTLPHGAGIDKDGRPPTEAVMQQLFNPFRANCARKGDSDISSTLVAYINRNTINHLVVGSPSRIQALTRAFKSSLNVAACLQRSLPGTCNLYVLSKTKKLKMKSAIWTPTPNTLFLSTKSAQRAPEEVNLRCKSNSMSGTAGFKRTSFARSIGRRLDYSDSMLNATRDKCYKSSSISWPTSLNADVSYEILDKSLTSDVSRQSNSSQNRLSSITKTIPN